ncbi:TRAP-type C4-dicarboxylate transport system, small permease component [Pannonibacter phragmitetus]|uniref:TRAP transporter small permease protein n=1 Tax=Pannonibacter phragmitetus TaxID=121719 RepID=A0A378ZW56_9HYPH|nr:TRAP transporter small permease [Pannonibacter phragmitetus]SUB01445.1 TRAP-type C4-dicarboxylate transport system, small permease component [Pannonibacter phragmitetus]
MGFILATARYLGLVNGAALAAGRWIGAGCVGLMVIIILIQVFFRYVLNDAPAWTEEAARFLMLWMTGLMVPTAFRRGGFVGIDMLVILLPRLVAGVLNLVLLILIAGLLFYATRLGWKEVTGIGGRFAMAAISVPVSLDFSAWMKVPRAWMMASLAVGCTAMLAVCIELILRSLITLMGGERQLAPVTETQSLGAE